MHVPTESLTAALGEISACLRSHPCIAQALVTVDEDQSDEPKIVAWVIPEPAMFRVTASGRCTLIGLDGREWGAELADVSFDGLRVRLDEGQVAPEVGAQVQIHVECSAIGGLVGWMGHVAWQAGTDLGLGFVPGTDEEQLHRFVQAFGSSASGAIPVDTTIGLRTRVALDVPVKMRIAGGSERCLRSFDVSPSGIGVEGYEGPDPVGNPVEVSIGVPQLKDERIFGIAVRQSGDRVGVGLVTDDHQQEALRTLVESAIRMRVVTAPILSRWMREALPDSPQPDLWFIVDQLPDRKA